MSTRQITPEMPTPSSRGISPLLFPALLWCPLLTGILFVAGAGLDKAYRQLQSAPVSQSSDESLLELAEKNVRAHPRLELRNLDTYQKVITYRDRDANKIYTISFEEAAQGRFPGRDDRPAPELLTDASLLIADAGAPTSPPAEAASSTPASAPCGLLDLDTDTAISLDDPTTGGLPTLEPIGDFLSASALLPSWIPTEEDWRLAQSPEHTENAVRETWRATAHAPGAMETLAEQSVTRLEAAGFTVTRRSQQAGRMSAEIVRAEHVGEKRSVGLAFTRDSKDGPIRIAITAESAK